MANVRRVNGIPYWFTLLLHYWGRRKCRRVGHVGSDGRPAMYICVHCGQLMNGMTNEQADENAAKIERWLYEEDR